MKLRIGGLVLAAAIIAGAGGCSNFNRSAQPVSAAVLAAGPTQRTVSRAAPATLGQAADAAAATLENGFYHAPGRWNMCLPNTCGSAIRDWGADSLLYALYLRWEVADDRDAVAIMRSLTNSAPDYRRCRRPRCREWSDIPLWDAIAAAREFEMTGDRRALEKARRAFDFVDRSDAFALGACPSIDYQRPGGGSSALKTLETDSNYIKAALLLHHWTGSAAYLAKARAKYAAVRRYFLDRSVPLYSVYVFDDGTACRQLPQRFFASVNGNMIYAGLALAAQTGDPRYRHDALATARAVTHYLSDPSGVYADLQADNDVAEPLIEAMYDVAAGEHETFARRWLLAAAAVAEPAPSGGYGRFFDGPIPVGPVSAWSSGGGLALAIAAGALDAKAAAAPQRAWDAQQFIADPIAAAPATIRFHGRAIALIGTLGEVCCEAGHVRVFIDGRETFDNTGIWQNKSPAARSFPGSILLSWRWPRSGAHTIALEPGAVNAKEGGSFIHLSGYELVP